MDDDELAVTPAMRRYYLEQRRGERAAMAEAAAAGDLAAVRHLSHKIKGSGALYGFADLSHASRVLNEAAKAGDLDAVRAAAEIWDAVLGGLFAAHAAPAGDDARGKDA